MLVYYGGPGVHAPGLFLQLAIQISIATMAVYNFVAVLEEGVVGKASYLSTKPEKAADDFTMEQPGSDESLDE